VHGEPGADLDVDELGGGEEVALVGRDDVGARIAPFRLLEQPRLRMLFRPIT
jgi:hypothetical protein